MMTGVGILDLRPLYPLASSYTCTFVFHPGGSKYAKCSGRILMHFAPNLQEAVYAYYLKALLRIFPETKGGD